MDEHITVKKEVLIKTEVAERPEEQNEKHDIEIQLEEQGEVQTVVLQNLQFADEQSPVILNHFPTDDSDGNLQIDTLEEDEVVHAYIIENDEYENLEGHEIIYQTVQEDGTTVQYIIAEEEEEGEEVYEQVEHLDETENDQQMEYTYEYEQVEMVDNHEMIEEEEDAQILEEEVVDMPQEENSNAGTAEEVEEPPEEGEEKPKILTVKEEVFNCELCGKSLKTAVGLKRHISTNHEEAQGKGDDDPLSLQLCPCCGEPSDTAHSFGDYKCNICDKLFVQLICLNRHCSIEHPANGQYQCVECKKVLDDKDALSQHMFLHPIRIFKCPSCRREFNRRYDLARHICQSSCMGPRKTFECRVCSRVFTRKDNLAEHLRGHAGQAKPKKIFKCTYCGKEFCGNNLLQIHERTHTGERPFPCDLCPKKFPSSGALAKHRRMHTGEKPYECDQCQKRFAAKETLNRHVKTHTGERPHTCQFCGKSFIQPSQLRAHIFHHTGENGYSCPHCGRAFNRKLRLTTHIKYMHEGADPIPCKVCGKTFFRNEDIQRHMVCHSNEKPYSCDICNKAFAVKSSLKLHKLTHQKEPPCSCDTCGRAFIRKDCLIRHIRARHRDVLEDIMASAEKKRLQQQLLKAATDAAACQKLSENLIWNELTLTESVKELLTLLVEEDSLAEFGYPDAPVDKVLDCVIKRCGHKPASDEDFDYIGRMRENAKLLFTVVIDDSAVKELLNNQTVDEVILQVLRLAKKQNS